MSKANSNRLQELLIDNALFGLDDQQQQELNKLSNIPSHNRTSGHGDEDVRADISFELAAAAVDLGNARSESMPMHLRERILNEGRSIVAQFVKSPASNETLTSDNRSNKPASIHSEPLENRWSAGDEDAVVERIETPVNWREMFAWTAAASVGLLAYFLYSWSDSKEAKYEERIGSLQATRQVLEKDIVNSNLVVDQLKSAAADAENARLNMESRLAKLELEQSKLSDLNSNLLAENQTLKTRLEVAKPDDIYRIVKSRPGAIQWPWSGGVNSEVKGEVVWDPEEQVGAMRFAGMPPNDPQKSQYQLWIVEEDGRQHPVDGGVFDIESDSEIFVRIDPALMAGKPKTFAVTVERPGGVVVSQEKTFSVVAQAPAKGDGSVNQ